MAFFCAGLRDDIINTSNINGTMSTFSRRVNSSVEVITKLVGPRADATTKILCTSGGNFQGGTWCCDGMVYHHLMGW